MRIRRTSSLGLKLLSLFLLFCFTVFLLSLLPLFAPSPPPLANSVKINPAQSSKHDYAVQQRLSHLPTNTETAKAKFPRIFCMVPSHPGNYNKYKTILDTWGPWCDNLRFMVDPPKPCCEGSEFGMPEEQTEAVTSSDGKVWAKIVYLNKMHRRRGDRCFTGSSAYNAQTGQDEPQFTPCRHIWEKVWRSWVYVADHYLDEYDFFFKVDDDTYFFVPTMREVINSRGWKPEEMHYFGHKVYPVGPDAPLIAGALVGFSRALLRAVSAKYKVMDREYGDRRNFGHGRCVDRDGATEEVTTSICVRELGVEPEPLYDSSRLPRRPHMHLWMPRDMLTFTRRDNSSSWFYRSAPRDVGTTDNCCSNHPVGYHFMRLEFDLYRIHELVVDPDGKKELENVAETKIPRWRMKGNGHAGSVFDETPFPAKTCIKEAEYWLDVKKEWHKRSEEETMRRLYDKGDY